VEWFSWSIWCGEMSERAELKSYPHWQAARTASEQR
jgi:hypothetical protein